MIKLNINKMELPVFDVIRAVPFWIPITEKKNLYFEIPNTNSYFKFESKYLCLINKYFLLFSKVMFLELKEFESMDLKKQFLKELNVVMQNNKYKKDFIKIIQEYFTADFNMKNILDIINPIQLSYLMLFIHNIVENVKKNFMQARGRLGVQMSETFSISSKAPSTKIEPRF